MSDLFVDRLGNIVIADGVARLDFLRLNEIDAEKKQARMAPSVRLAIPLTSLVQAIEMLDKMRGELARQAQAGTQPTREILRPTPTSDA
jgi:hypothetical protein